MPIFEYVCDDCGAEFDLLVRGRETPACTACGSTALTKKLSLPRVQSDGTRARALKAAKARDARQGRERMHTRLEYEASHDD